jgi:hypothetical protein
MGGCAGKNAQPKDQAPPQSEVPSQAPPPQDGSIAGEATSAVLAKPESAVLSGVSGLGSSIGSSGELRLLRINRFY